MAIGTPVSIFGAADSTHPWNITTTGAVPSGNTVIIMVWTYQSSGAGDFTVSTAGGLTWTRDFQVKHNTSYSFACFSAPAPSGLASSTALAVSLSGTGQLAAGISCLHVSGLASPPVLVDTASAFADPGSTADWWGGGTPGTVDVAGEALLLAAAFGDAALSTSTTDSPATELTDVQVSTESWTVSTAYRVVSTGGNYTIDGNFAAGMSFGTGTALVAYSAAVSSGITVDQTNLGTANDTVDGTTIALTTSQPAAAGARIIVCIGWANAPQTCTGVVNSGTDLGWTIDIQGRHSSGSFPRLVIASAYAPSGLASSTVITATFSGASGGNIGASSFLGVAPSSYVDDTDGATNGAANGVWTNSLTTTADALLIGADFTEAGGTHAATAGTELWESVSSWPVGTAAVYRIEPTAGTYSVAGDWSNTSSHVSMAVAYLAGEEEEAAAPSLFLLTGARF